MAVDLDLLRAHVGQGPSDDVLAGLLDAALEAIDDRYGPADAGGREYLRPFGEWVKLGRRASTVEAVLEGGSALGEEDYELWPGGRFLRRLSGAQSTAWAGMVDVTYTPLPEDAGRDRIVIALCDLDLNRSPGLAGITVGPWSEQYTQSDEGYQAQREAILGSLRARSIGTW